MLMFYSIDSPNVCWLVLAVSALIITYLIYDFFKAPFYYPHIRKHINISGRRQPSYEECIDEWINNLSNPRQDLEDMYNNELNSWIQNCESRLNTTIFWRYHKRKIFQNLHDEIIDNGYQMFEFEFSRIQTRYRQQNYQKYSFKVRNIEKTLTLSLQQILEIDDELEEINYETTRAKYYAKNQRRLMTKELRQKIKIRDNYTCQSCGKYMPDEVGLHIDHIIPIKDGGKTVESNLQVLCDKCNLGKGSKKVNDVLMKS